MDEELAPPGLLDDDAAPPLLGLPVLLVELPPVVEDDPVPLVELPVLPMPPLGELLELDAPPGADDEPAPLGAVVEDEEDEPPGTTMVSFSFVTVLVLLAGGEPLGTTVVVSLRSHAESARAPMRTSK